MTRALSLTVNGRAVEAFVEPRMHLADLVRDVLHLTGTHLGCEHGVCGACTVLVDGAPTRSCIAYAIACEGADVRTIEGLEDDPVMQALRHAFTRHHALQCGYCTPGMLITAHDIVRRLPGADETRVREELSGNLCRCTGYVGIVEAVRSVLAAPPARDSGVNGSTGDRYAPTSVTIQRSTAPEPTFPARSSGSDNGGGASRKLSARQGVGTSTSDGSQLEIHIAIAPDSLWNVLKDIATVVRCIPGASLESPPNADPLSLGMTVAIGPMRARFEGSAHVAFDDLRRDATIDGSGHDTRSRSTGEGRIELAVRTSKAGGSTLRLRLHYTLKGPLAQFSRGAVVDAVVEQLLDQFAANLVSTTAGMKVESSPHVGGFGLVAAAIRRWLQRWLLRGGR